MYSVSFTETPPHTFTNSPPKFQLLLRKTNAYLPK